MAVKRRVRFRIEPYQRARSVEKGRKQGAENGLGAAWARRRSASLRRVRPLKRPAVSRRCKSAAAAASRLSPRGDGKPRWYHGNFKLPSLCSIRLAGAGAFLMLPFPACADCAAPPLYIYIFIIERETNYDYSS